MAAQVHTPAELRDLLATVIAGTVGGTEPHWQRVIGTVQKLPIATNARSNWRVSPVATDEELGVIRRAVEIVRAAHPYVAG